MLKLGQDVIIYDTPAYGDEYFDEDYMYERATICGITTINDELAYQLEGYDEDKRRASTSVVPSTSVICQNTDIIHYFNRRNLCFI